MRQDAVGAKGGQSNFKSPIAESQCPAGNRAQVGSGSANLAPGRWATFTVICCGKKSSGLKCGTLLSEIPVPADHVSAGKTSDGLCPECFAIQMGKAQVAYIDHDAAPAPTHCENPACGSLLTLDLQCPKCGVSHTHHGCPDCGRHGVHMDACSLAGEYVG